jgi:hypothetical protein
MLRHGSARDDGLALRGLFDVPQPPLRAYPRKSYRLSVDATVLLAHAALAGTHVAPLALDLHRRVTSLLREVLRPAVVRDRRLAPPLEAEHDRLVAQTTYLTAVVRIRERDDERAAMRSLIVPDPASALAGDDPPPARRPDRDVPVPDEPRRSLPRQTRAGPAANRQVLASDDEGGRRGPAVREGARE